MRSFQQFKYLASSRIAPLAVIITFTFVSVEVAGTYISNGKCFILRTTALKCGRKIHCQNGGKISPAGVEVKLSYFVTQIPKFASMALLSQQLLLKWSSQKEA